MSQNNAINVSGIFIKALACKIHIVDKSSRISEHSI